LPKNARRSARTIANLKLRLLHDLVPKIARAVGPLCEVVLHQNTSQPPTVLSIGNGHITGRTIGDLMTRVLVNGEDVRDRKTPLFNYLSQMPDGRRIRVSLIPIIDDGKVIAYLSVNFLVQDLSMARQALKLLVDAEPHDEAIHEVFLSPTEVIGKPMSDPAIRHITEQIDLMFHDDAYRFSDEENFVDLKKRARKALRYLARQHHKRVVVVTHGIFLKMLIAYLLYRNDLHAPDWVKLSFFSPADNAAITLCAYYPLRRFGRTRGWEVLSYNITIPTKFAPAVGPGLANLNDLLKD